MFLGIRLDNVVCRGGKQFDMQKYSILFSNILRSYLPGERNRIIVLVGIVTL